MYILFRLVLVMLPVMLVMGYSRAQVVDTVFAGESTVLAVEEVDGVSWYWELYNDVDGLNLAVVPGNCPPAEAFFVGGVNTGDSVEVTWVEPGIYFFKVTGTDTCTNNIKVGKMVVLEGFSYATFLDPGSVCSGDTAMLTLEFTGAPGPWDVTFTDGTNVWTIEDIDVTPYSFQLIPTPTVAGSYQYWVISVTNKYGKVNDVPSAPVTLIVHPKPVTSPIYRY